MVYMPGDVSGKSWKLVRPYHGLFRILSVIPTNAKVQLIEKPEEPSLFVALSRLRRCYPEMTVPVGLVVKRETRLIDKYL